VRGDGGEREQKDVGKEGGRRVSYIAGVKDRTLLRGHSP
jgi:hypothetical protein